MALTRKQKALKAEIQQIAEFIGVNHWNAERYDPDGRTVILELMKNQMVRGEIIMLHTLIDELLSDIVCSQYFPKGRSFASLWRTKKFQIFNHHVIEVLGLLEKLAFVRAAKKVPKDVVNNIERINSLRNAIAHSFFPENKRKYRERGKVTYRDIDIFSLDGIKALEADFGMINKCLWKMAFG
jgi:hypothetical protein